MTVEATLIEVGVAPGDAAALATWFLDKHRETLNPEEARAHAPRVLLLQVALTAARVMRQWQPAIQAIIADLEPNSNALDRYDAGRFWHLRGLAAWRYEGSTFLATNAFNRSIACLASVGAELAPRAARYRARVHDSLGQLLNHQGLLIEARTEYQHSLRLRDPVLDQIGLAITHGNLGRLSMDLGEYARAIVHFEADLAVVDAMPSADARTRAQLRTHLGVAHVRRGDPGDFARAAALLGESAAIAEGPPALPSAKAFARLGHAQLALARDDVEAARAAAVEVSADVERDPASFTFDLPAVRGLAHKIAGDAARYTGDREGAIAAYDRALGAFGEQAATSLVEYSEILRNQSALVRSEDEARATGLLKRALEKLDGTAATDLRGEIEAELHKQDRFAWLMHSTGRFVGHANVESLLGEAGREGFRGDRREITVLFSDLRGFTTLSENLEPRDLIAVLNDYLTLMTHCVREHGGQVDKFIGDAVMATWSFDAVGCAAAIDAALAMRVELERFNRRPDLASIPLAIGVGIHGGPVIEGLIGSPQKREKTVLGDTVNTASRMEGLTKYLGAEILVSDAVFGEVGEAGAAKYLRRRLGHVVPKGKRTAIGVSDVMGLCDHSPQSAAIEGEIRAADAAFAAFAGRDFTAAREAFAALAQGDGPGAAHRRLGYELFEQAAIELAIEAPPDAWRGEIVLSEK